MSGRVENNVKIQVVSEFQTCGLGMLPPRMPDRADPQVPDDAALGDVRYGRIGHVYFHDENSDALVGMIEVEVSVQRLDANTCRVEAFGVGDGFQSCSATGQDAPLTIQLCRKDGTVVAESTWAYSKILCNFVEVLTHKEDLAISKADFESLAIAVLPAVKGAVFAC